jgi:hypothetical protein
MGPILHLQCTFTWDGQDRLEVLVMGATMQDMAVTEVSASSRTGGARDMKTGPSGTPNQTIQVPREE